MLRTTLVLVALTLAPQALACGDKKCGDCAGAAASAEAPSVDEAAGTKVTLSITGMSCGGCAGKITAALTGTKGVNAASVDHETGRARIAYDAATIDVDGLVAAIATAGHYTAALVTDGS